MWGQGHCVFFSDAPIADHVPVNTTLGNRVLADDQIEMRSLGSVLTQYCSCGGRLNPEIDILLHQGEDCLEMKAEMEAMSQ